MKGNRLGRLLWPCDFLEEEVEEEVEEEEEVEVEEEVAIYISMLGNVLLWWITNLKES